MLTPIRRYARTKLVNIFLLSSIWILTSVLLFLVGQQKGREIEIKWQTETEYDTVGYNIYRSERPDGQYARINESLIPAKGDSTTGANYTFIDTNFPDDTEIFYRLEDVEYNGEKKFHPPIVVKSPGASFSLQVLALISGIFGIFLFVLGLRSKKVTE